MSVVLFLGAGFSAHFGQPTMNSFGRYAEQVLKGSDVNFYRALTLETRQANAMIESSPTNLEDILTYAVMGDRVEIYGEKNEPRTPRIKQILRSVCAHIPQNISYSYWDRYQVFKEFLGLEKTEQIRDLSIVTTNYDLNIESALHYVSQVAILPFKYQIQLKGESIRKKLGRASLKQTVENKEKPE